MIIKITNTNNVLKNRLIASEVFPLKVRAKALGIATFMNRGFSAVIASTFLSLSEIFKPEVYFLVLAIITIIAGI